MRLFFIQQGIPRFRIFLHFLFIDITPYRRCTNLPFHQYSHHHYLYLSSLQTSVLSNGKKVQRYLSTTRHSSTRQIRNSSITRYVNVQVAELHLEKTFRTIPIWFNLTNSSKYAPMWLPVTIHYSAPSVHLLFSSLACFSVLSTEIHFWRSKVLPVMKQDFGV